MTIKKRNDEEHHEQVKVCKYLDLLMNKWHNFKYFAVPNGGKRNIITAKKLKSEGVKAGVPDMFILPTDIRHKGLAIEMKKIKGGVVSKNQKEWIYFLVVSGWDCEVCNGFEEAKIVIDRYFNFINYF